MQTEKGNTNAPRSRKDIKLCSHLEVHTHTRNKNPLELKKTKQQQTFDFAEYHLLSQALQFH